MITPAYSPTATERVLPRLALDFTTATLDPRVTVTRALNTATRINSSGLVVGVNADLPRFDYDPITKVCKGLLIEETRSNIQLQSEDFATTWSPSGINVSTNSAIAPDGNLTADTLTATASPGNIAYLQAVTNGATYTFSLFVKKLSSDTVQLNFANVAAGPVFTFSTESFSTVASWTTSIQKLDNGWYRISATRASNTTFAGMQIRIANNGEAIYAFGAQMEAGAFPTSYIPTTTTSVTRNADQVSMTGTNFTSWFTAGVGTLYSEASQPTIFASSRSSASICTSGANNPRLSCYRQSAGTLNGYAINGAGTGNGVSGGASAVANTVHKTVLSYSATNAQRVCANGNAGNPMTVDMTTSMASLNALSIGSDFVGAPTTSYCGYIRKIMWWPLQMTQAEAQAFSK